MKLSLKPLSLPVENYVSPISPDVPSVQKIGVYIWLATVTILFLWVSLIVFAPITAANGINAFADAVYAVFSYVCHQANARSFHLLGYKLAVCARCFGIYFGLLSGVLFYPTFKGFANTLPPPRLWLILAPLPTTVDFLLGIFNIWANTHLSRAVTGAIMGFGLVFFIMPGLVDIGSFFFREKRAAKPKTFNKTSAKSNVPSDYSKPDLRI